jgi:hypothetical protein
MISLYCIYVPDVQYCIHIQRIVCEETHLVLTTQLDIPIRHVRRLNLGETTTCSHSDHWAACRVR